MKELSIEEKAQRYDEALERASNLHKDAVEVESDIIAKTCETIFPELKKEDEDERIRKDIISYLKSSTAISPKTWIAWLEKQGEQKLETPKFHKGEWVVWENKCYKVNDNGCGYELIGQDGLSTSLEYGTIDENAHLWYITKDAKDGGVLATDDWVFIFKKLNTDGKPVCYCHYDIELGFHIDVNTYISTGSYIRPATREQRDTLLKAMSDAGYTFDFVKKELKKIEQKPTEWSEEDDKKILLLETLCDDQINSSTSYSTMYREMRELKNWLKSIKDRVGCEINGTTTSIREKKKIQI